MTKVKVIIAGLFIALILGSIIVISQGIETTSTTAQIKVTDKGTEKDQKWIYVVNKMNEPSRIIVNDNSLWSLINKDQEYTITYSSKRKGPYYLDKIVPSTYNGSLD
jgi:hypothetical protein